MPSEGRPLTNTNISRDISPDLSSTAEMGSHWFSLVSAYRSDSSSRDSPVVSISSAFFLIPRVYIRHPLGAAPAPCMRGTGTGCVRKAVCSTETRPLTTRWRPSYTGNSGRNILLSSTRRTAFFRTLDSVVPLHILQRGVVGRFGKWQYHDADEGGVIRGERRAQDHRPKDHAPPWCSPVPDRVFPILYARIVLAPITPRDGEALHLHEFPHTGGNDGVPSARGHSSVISTSPRRSCIAFGPHPGSWSPR